ncbi:hypothetical protein BJX62DRAFT_219322 [Aspergillus germanicus]
MDFARFVIPRILDFMIIMLFSTFMSTGCFYNTLYSSNRPFYGMKRFYYTFFKQVLPEQPHKVLY